MSFLPDRTLDHLRRLSGAPAPERYRVEREIGRGGMGVVYQAWDTQLDRRVALKIIDFGPVEEARIAARLEHPGLVPVYDSGTLPDGRAYYAMRLVQGRRLDEFAAQEPGLGERLRILVKVCDAVAFAHDRGVVHCDLKPQNIMVGSFGEVFVMDWGIARLGQLESPAARTGTPPYLAPEHPVDHRADIFSLGRILLDLAGDRPIRPLAAVAARATAAEPGERYQSVQDLAADLTRFLDGLPVTAHAENLWERTVRYVRRNQVLLLLIAAFLVVKLALFFFRRP
jgi:serine/threonine protein kinase